MKTTIDTWAVIWDVDGVLVDSTEAHFISWQQLFAEEKLPWDREIFLRTFGLRNDLVLRAHLGSALSPQLAREYGERKEKYFRDLIPQLVRPIPGALALVASLQTAGVGQAIGSSAPRANVDATLAALGLPGVFGAVAAAEDVRSGKPAPDVFLLAASGLGIAPSRCVVLEDAPLGVEAARAAGMRCVAVATTRPAAELGAADRVVASLGELSPATLRALLPGLL